MKLKSLFISAIAAIATLVGCAVEEPAHLDNIQVDKSYVGFLAEGNTVTINVDAKANWEFTNVPEWLTVSPMTGAAGATKVSLTAGSATETREAEILIKCGSETQRINVQQVTAKTETPISSCAEVSAKTSPDSKTYRVKGVVTRISETAKYGNFYVSDGTAELYIYGTKYKGQTEQAALIKLGIEVGDEVIVEGPKTTYNDTPELVDVDVIDIIKSLIKVDSVDPEDATLPLEGGDFTVTLTNKGKGVSVTVPEAAKSWISVSSVMTSGNTSTVVFNVAPNEGGDRNVDLTFITTDGSKEYTAKTNLLQKGAILDVNIAEFNAAPVGDTYYRITAVVSSVADAEKGNIYLKDFSGETYVYKLAGFADSGIKADDIITIVGKRDQYKDTIEMTNATVEEVKSVETVTIAEFLAKEDNKNVYYKVTGTIKSIDNADYGNVYLTDGTNELYAYGLYPGYGATGDARKGFLAAAGIEVGDVVTMIGYKDTYKEKIEICGGIYVSHEKGE